MQITIIYAKEVAALTALIALTPSRLRFPTPHRSFVSALSESLPTLLNRYLHFLCLSQNLVRRSRVDESVRPEYSPHMFSTYHSCRDSRAIRLDVSMSARKKSCRWAKHLLTADTFFVRSIHIMYKRWDILFKDTGYVYL